jgi:hypothetical protein
MNTLNSNSANTMDKKINITYNLYTAYKNDTMVVNYGDSSQETFYLNSSKLFYIENKKII